MVKEYSCPKPTKKKFQVYILCIALYLAVFFIVPYPIKPFCLLFSIIPFIRFRLKRYYKQYIDYSQVKIRITEERIELLEYGIPSYSIRRNALHIGHYVSFGEWFYVFTVILVITFAIEIGQHITHTGTLEFYDIAFGIVGFLFLFGIFALFRGIVLLVISLVKRKE